jgi:hypothetical protein
VGAPILEASVFTTAEVKPGGSITVYLITNKASENEKRTKLYTCDPKEIEVHPIPPELLRGSMEVSLVAVIEQVAAYTTKVDRRHVRGPVYKGKFLQAPGVDVVHHKVTPDYKAVLFPSFPTTSEAFRLKAMIADPAPQLDKLFEANPDALK